jgi:hypothetical protein
MLFDCSIHGRFPKPGRYFAISDRLGSAQPTSAHAADGVGAPLARRDFGHATWAIVSRELCPSRIDANGKPVAESNLSLRALPRGR